MSDHETQDTVRLNHREGGAASAGTQAITGAQGCTHLQAEPVSPPPPHLAAAELGKRMCHSHGSHTVHTRVSGGKTSIITSSSEKQKIGFPEGSAGCLRCTQF